MTEFIKTYILNLATDLENLKKMIWLRHILRLLLFTPVMSETVRRQYRRFNNVTLPAVTTSTIVTTSTGCCHICTTKPTCSIVRYNESSHVCEEGSSALLLSPSPYPRSEIVYASGSSIYELVRIKMTWNDAKINCEVNGGQLVKVETSEEHDQLTAWLQSFGHDPSSGFGLWIGLNDLLSEGSFTWADGSALDGFRNWADTQPDDYEGKEDCVETEYTNSTWNDYKCEELLWSFCEYN